MPCLSKGYSHKNKQSCATVHVGKHKTSTTDKGAEHHCRSALLANQHGGYDRHVQSRQNDLKAKTESLFIVSFIRPQAMSVTSCRTRFYSQLVDFSGAINPVDPRRPRLGRSQATLEEADRRGPEDRQARPGGHYRQRWASPKESLRVSRLPVSQGLT